MSTLILKSALSIKNPRFGKLPDLDTGLRFALDARDLELSNGAEVSRWVANRGIGSNAEKTFSQKFRAHKYPIFDTSNGRKSVKFSGEHQIFNGNDDYFISPASYIVVGKINNLRPSANGVARLFCGDFYDKTTDNNAGYTNDQWQQIAPHEGGLVMMTGTATKGTERSAGSVIPFGTDWFVAVFVFDGVNSKMLSSLSTNINREQLTPSRQNKIGLGISFGVTDETQSGLNGNISYLAQYERALTDNEMRAAIDYFSREFGI